jgi:hypothetical protein
VPRRHGAVLHLPAERAPRVAHETIATTRGPGLAAGEGFEPSLTDPEPVPPRYTSRRREIQGDKTAFLWEV